MNFIKSEIHLIAECRRTCNCSESPFLNTSVYESVRKQKKKTPNKQKNIFMRFHLHANLNVCFKFSFSRIFRKVKKYSIISILLNKPFSFALYKYMLCIIWVHVKEADLITCILPSVATARNQQGLLENHILHEKMSVPVTPQCIFYLFIRLIWSSDDRW